MNARAKFFLKIFFIAVFVFAGGVEFSSAATYNFFQSDWSGGTTATYPNHTSDQNNWAKFSTSTNIISSATGVLTATSVPSVLSARTDVTANWTNPSVIDNINGRKIAIATSTGVVYVVYYSKEYSVARNNIALRSSADNFASRVDITTGSGATDCSAPSIVVDASNVAHVVYVCTGGAMYYVNSSNWNNSVSIGTGSNPSIAAHGGVVHLTYYTSNIVYYASSTAWATKIAISTNASAANPSIAVDSTGKVGIAYYSKEYNASYFNVAYRDSSNWGTRVDLTTSTTFSSLYPSIAVDSTGKFIVVYYSNEYNSTYTNIAYRDSSNWGTRVNITTSTARNSTYPSVAIDSTNKVSVVYQSFEYTTANNNIAYRNSDNWSVRTDVTTSTTSFVSATYSSLAVDSNNKIHIAYNSREIANTTFDNIAYRNNVSGNFNTRVDITSNWSRSAFTGENVSGLEATAISPLTGVVYLAYYSQEYSPNTYNIALRSSTDNFASRTDITTLTSGAAQYPSIAITPNGKIHIAYKSTEYAGGSSNVAYRNSDNWGARVDITTSNISSKPSIAVDSANNVYIVYVSGEYGGQNNIAYRKSNNWGTRIDVTTETVTDFVFSSPVIAVDSTGKVHIAYYSLEYNGGAIPYNVAYRNSDNWATRVDISTSVSGDGRDPSIAVDSNNKAHIAYVSYEYSSRQNIAYRNSDNWAVRTDITTNAGSIGTGAPNITSASGKIHIVYQSTENNLSANNIAYRNSDNWGVRVDITTSTTRASASPSAAIDSSGRVNVVYTSLEYDSAISNIAYKIYQNSGYSSGNLISNWYNTESSLNLLSKVIWNEDASLPSDTTLKFQLQTAPDSSGAPGTGTGFMGPNGLASDYFTNSATGCSKSGTQVTCTIPSGISIGDGASDQWLQYKVFINGAVLTPTLQDATLQYNVNAPPEFNASFGTNGVLASQIATSTDSDWGKVQIQYSVRDTDTNTGSSTPGFITPSFSYNTGSGWFSIGSQYLASGNLNNKAVATSTYNTHTAIWDAKTQLNGTYSTTTQIRVTANDNEIANPTASAIGNTFSLDVKNPTSTLFRLNSMNDNISYILSDDNNIEYVISNNSDLSSDSANALSNGWQSAGAPSVSATTAWTFSNTSSFRKVYYSARDIYGNSMETATAVAPSTPANFDLKDVSNPSADIYQEFISWQVYSATTSAAFSSYAVYRSTNGSSYSLLTTINDAALNYYRDANLSSSTTYYYKVVTTDTDTDTSGYSTVLSDLPNGQGGTDFTPPVISSTTIALVQASWVKFTWVTDELATGEVQYSAAPNTYNLSASSTSYSTNHEVTVSNLTPNTLYYFRVKSTDIMNNSKTDDNSGIGYSTTTMSGPSISSVVTESITDNGALITWNTDKAADSYVVYSTDLANLRNEVSVSTVGTSVLVDASPYQHRVSLTGLTSRTTYYYYVKSTDASGNLANDKNGNNYYSFNTTYDAKSPVISNIVTPVITRNAAIILWQTDENSTSQVNYGEASGVYASSTALDATLSVYHNAVLSGLKKLTAYYFVVKSQDAAGNLGTSSEQTLTTTDYDQVVITQVSGGGAAASTDTAAPQIINSSVKDISGFGATISVETDEDTTVYVLYGKDGKTYPDTAASSDFKKSHDVKLSGLRFGTDYHYKIKAQDKSGNVSVLPDKIFTTKFVTESLDETTTLENASQFQDKLENILESVLPSLAPPFVGTPEVKSVTESSAEISWKTNVSTYGSVAYSAEKDYAGTNANPYSAELNDGDLKAREHTLEITGLSPATTYHFQAKGFIFPGVTGKSKDLTFTTKSSKISTEIAKLGNTDMEVRWVTAAETNSFAEYKDLRTGKIGRSGDEAMTKTHSVLLENLIPDTTYQIRSFGYDTNNNIVEGDPITVKTKKDTTPPEISNIQINNALIPGRSDRLQSVISWRTDEPANSMVYFEEGVGVGDIVANKAGQEKEYTNDHIVIVTGFKPATVYRIQIVSADESDNKAKSSPRSILTPRSAESVLDVITKNLEDTFGFLKKLQK